MSWNKRYDARTDANQSSIIKHIDRLPNHEVLDLSGVGDGCTDILVQQKKMNGSCWEVRFFLIEIKTKDGKLNPKQVKFHKRFQCHIIRNLDQLWGVLGI